MRTTYTNENIAKIIEEKRPDYRYISGKVGNQASRINVEHIPCGNVCDVIVKGFLAPEIKGRCKICEPVPVVARVTGMTEKDIKAKFAKTFPDKDYLYVSGFINTKSKITVLHTVCNSKFNVTPHMLFGSKKSRCPDCANKRRKEYQAVNRVPNYLTELLKRNGLEEDYYWMEEYTGDNKYKHLIFHRVCGNRALIRPNDVQQGYLPCTCEGSKYEVKFKRLLDEYNIPYQREFKLGERLRVDFAIDIPNTDSKIFIEVDGEFHALLEQQQALDARKEQLIAEKFPTCSFIRVSHTDNFYDVAEQIHEFLTTY